MLKRLTSSDIWLRQEIQSSEQKLGRSRIIANGRDTGQVVDGVILEAAVQWRNCMLLFLTDDTPFEEFLRIYLFDPRWDLLDRAAIGAMYNGGIFSSLELAPPDAVRFKFYSGTVWELALFDTAAFSLPSFAPRNVFRPFGFRKHFDLIEHPASDIGR